MAITVSMTVSSTTPASGDTLTVTYVVTGNGTPAASESISGNVTINGITYKAVTTITLPAVPGAAVTYALPTAPGLTFVATSKPNVFTALVP